jgi:hypothetical protein
LRLNCPVGEFPFIFQEISDDDFYQTDWVLSNPSGQLVEEFTKNNISKNQHDPTVATKDMATGALFALPNSTLLSLAEFSLLCLTLFFGLVGLFSVLKT